jgi:hypothetical protein
MSKIAPPAVTPTNSLLLPIHAERALHKRTTRFGGGERNRTVDLLLAKQALSQLSYTPAAQAASLARRQISWWAREDLNLRPHAYQARALTN